MEKEIFKLQDKVEKLESELEDLRSEFNNLKNLLEDYDSEILYPDKGYYHT